MSDTHKLRVATLGSQVTREWTNLSTGLVETDAAVIAQLNAALTSGCDDCSLIVNHAPAQCVFDADGNSIGTALVKYLAEVKGCTINSESYSTMVVGMDGVVRPIGSGEVIGSCVSAEPVISCDGFAFGEATWGAGETLCQSVTAFATSNNPGTIEYSFNGGEFGNNTFECENDEEVTVVARDGAGCEITQILSNTRNLEEDIWTGSGTYVSAISSLEETGVQAISTASEYASQFEVNNATTGSWEAYVSTNEFARLRDGSATSTNNLRLIGQPKINRTCPVALNWQTRITASNALQTGDVFTGYMEFKDDSGNLIERRQVFEKLGDFDVSVESGTETPPAGAVSADLVLESNTQDSTREHRVYINQNTFIKQVAV